MKVNLKAIFAVAVITAVGSGSYKAINSYTASNMTNEDLLFAENVMALSDNTPTKKYAWSNNIDCYGIGAGDYKVCQENGPQNACYEPGATTCTCGVNCD